MNRKSIIKKLIAVTLLMALAACSEKKESPKTVSDVLPANITVTEGAESADDGTAEVDLTQLSSTMVYSEVYNMMVTPKNYIGKTVKMRGQFTVYEADPDSDYNYGGDRYFSVVIADATACCQQGLEFVLAGDPVYPDDYPEVGTEISVTGTFEIYKEGEYQYCRLVNSKIVFS